MTTLAPDRPTVSRRIFTCVDPDAVRDRLLEGAAGLGVDVRRGQSVRFRETRLDTGDHRFERAGYRLAVREADGRTELVLEPLRHRAGRRVLRIRAPWPGGSIDSLPDSCPDPLRDSVRAVAGRRRLHGAGRISSMQETWQILREDRLIGTVTLRQLTRDDAVQPPRAEPARVEIELDDRETAAEGVLDLLSSLLAPAPAAPTGTAAPAGAKEKPGRAPAEGSVQETAFAALRRHFARATAREPGARLGADPEELHDLRVAVRRLRAALRLYRDHLPPKAARFRRELNRIGRALGEVRDLDVQIEWLRGHARDLPRSERDAVLDIVNALQRRRRTARLDMLETLDSPRTERFGRRFSAWLREGPRGKPRRGRRRITREAPRLIRKRMDAVIRVGAAIDASSPAGDYHALRILVKKARYALEFHADVYGDPATRVIRRLVALQDLLGEHQDAEVFLDHIRTLLEDDAARLGPEAAAALEHLAERRAEGGLELRAEFPRAFRRARGKRWKRLRRRLRRA